MSILASVCWKAGSVWLCCGRVCGIPRVVACPRVCPRCCVVAGASAGLACAWSRVLLRGGVAVFFASLRVVVRAHCYARGRVRVRVSAGLACGCVWGGRACVRGPPPGGVLWRFPTLPHPLGCSTIGAAGLSFQVRNVAGRFPGAVTTTRLCVQHCPPLFVCVWGCGLIVVRIVVAAVVCSLLVVAPARVVWVVV